MKNDVEKALDYYIISHGLFFKPDCKGYTGIRDEAGLYTKEKAESYHEAKAVHKNDAPQFSEKCFEDLKIKHLNKIIAALQPQSVDVELIAKDVFASLEKDDIIAGKTIEGYQDILTILIQARDKGYLASQGLLNTGWQPDGVNKDFINIIKNDLQDASDNGAHTVLSLAKTRGLLELFNQMLPTPPTGGGQ